VLRACERFAARRSDALVSVADAMTELMVEAGVAPPEKFTTVYSGMEVEPFLASDQRRQETRARLGYTQEHFVVGKIARLFPLKGHEYLVQAAAEAVRRQPRLRFLLVGDGILSGTIRDAVARAGLAAHFQFAGLVPPEEIPALIGAMDAVVHTSLREGLARVLPQALIAGKPAVSYDIDGAREVVIDEVTGFLLPPKSIEPLAAALARLAADRALAERMGQEGRRRFADQFRHENSTRRLRALYERVLAAKRAG
jgi:glycosyltransferase involved in cell wall biosynthesis